MYLLHTNQAHPTSHSTILTLRLVSSGSFSYVFSLCSQQSHPYSPFIAFIINNTCSPLLLLFTLRSLSPLKYTYLLFEDRAVFISVFLPTPCTVPDTQQAFNTSLLNECMNNFTAWMFKFLS